MCIWMCACDRQKEKDREGEGELMEEGKTAALHDRAWMKVKLKMEKSLRRLCVT